MKLEVAPESIRVRIELGISGSVTRIMKEESEWDLTEARRQAVDRE